MLRAELSVVEEPISSQHYRRFPERELWISNVVFVAIIHLLALLSVTLYQPHVKTLCLCVLLWQASGLGVTMGYHRLWAHRSYKASTSIRVVLALLGTIAFQGSIRWWVLRHRLHHRFVDTEEDPHNVKRGLWYSHIGWIFEKKNYEKKSLIDLDDIDSDPVARLQHQFFIPLAIILSFLLPTFLCSLWNDSLGGLLYGGFVMRVLIWHCIFSINSLAHFVGTQEYSKAISARGNWLLAFLTCGEGHHNFHHEFPHDYRNGIKWYDYDPTKWGIYILSLIGLTTELQETKEALILRAKREYAQQVTEEAKKYHPNMSWSEFGSKCKAGAKLIVIEGWILDISSYLDEHPGGAHILETFVGQDASNAFNGELNIHSHAARILAKEYRVARIK